MNSKYVFKPNLGFKIVEIILFPKQNSIAIQINMTWTKFSIKVSET